MKVQCFRSGTNHRVSYTAGLRIPAATFGGFRPVLKMYRRKSKNDADSATGYSVLTMSENPILKRTNNRILISWVSVSQQVEPKRSEEFCSSPCIFSKPIEN